MYITRKEIKTEIHAEISKKEFCACYYNMMLELFRKNLSEPRIHEVEVKDYFDSTDEEKTIIAENSFYILFDDGFVDSFTVLFYS